VCARCYVFTVSVAAGSSECLIESYFNIVRKNFADLVPKTIMCFLVNHVKENLQSDLVQQLYTDSSLETLLKESDDIASQRRSCAELKSMLTRAMGIVNEVKPALDVSFRLPMCRSRDAWAVVAGSRFQCAEVIFCPSCVRG
jgi:hypothetical protein